MEPPPPRFVLLAQDFGYISRSELYAGGDLADSAGSLTRALARSPIWDRMGPGILVLRTDPVPSLAALGRFDEADVARLSFLARWLEPTITSTRYLDHEAVVAAVEILAVRLRAVFGDEVRRFDFVGVPRGGLIVLGLLAYALDLDAERLEALRDPNRPLVIVDDCALTGNRFCRFIEEDPGSQWVFAHLCSPPELRTAMIDQVLRLSHAIAAIDLRDLAPSEYGENYAEWHTQVAQRIGDRCCWIGQPENVVFPWNEPDHNFLNTVTGESDWGWRLAPSERCLKRGSTSFPGGIPDQVSTGNQTGYRVANRLLFGCLEEQVFLFDRSTGDTLRLDEVGARVWDGLLAGWSAERIADGIVSRFDVDMERALTDVRSLTRDFLDRGVLISA